ncbi:MAG: hypothetical protein RSD81_21665 [Pseudomonas sp.]
MNRHPATLVQVSPLQVRQALFFSLALLLTLIVGQLYHHWQVVQDVQKVTVRATLVVKAPIPTPTKLMQSRPAVASTAAADTTTPRDRWVF